MTSFSHQDFSSFFGYTYDPHGFDCVDLLLAVQRKLFGRQVSIPADRNLARRQMRALFRTHLIETSAPQDGDVVLMRETGRSKADHVGTWFLLAGEACILHTTASTDTLFTRERQLATQGLTIEGIYAWRTP